MKLFKLKDNKSALCICVLNILHYEIIKYCVIQVGQHTSYIKNTMQHILLQTHCYGLSFAITSVTENP